MKTNAANQSRSETATFNQMAAHVLASQGWKVDGIADLLGISERTVWRHLKEPCDALEPEREGADKRAKWETHMRTKRGKAPFMVADFLRANGVLDDAGASWLNDGWQDMTTKEKVRLYLADGVVSQSWIARRLGVSRQAVAKLVKELRQPGTPVVHY